MNWAAGAYLKVQLFCPTQPLSLVKKNANGPVETFDEIKCELVREIAEVGSDAPVALVHDGQAFQWL